MGLVEQHSALNRPEHPVCSICIANYNGAALLDDCLTSVLAQQSNISIEIIVHDDASTDNSVALLRERYPQVELLASSENVGFCVSNNRMVAHARGEFVLLLNNDAALQPDALSILLATARVSDQPCILTLPQYDWATQTLVDRGCMLDPFYNPVPNLDPSRREVAMAIGACLFLPRTLWMDLDGFPEWMESIAEDMYLCCIARLRDASIQVTNKSGYFHKQGASFGGNRVDSEKLNTTFRRRRLSERNKTAVMVICTPTWLVWPLLVSHLIMLIIEGVVITLCLRDVRVWRDIYWATIYSIFAGMRVLRTRRLHQQAQRRISLRRYLHTCVWVPRKLQLFARHGVPSIR